jgi:hypothetical protein
LDPKRESAPKIKRAAAAPLRESVKTGRNEYDSIYIVMFTM